MATQKRWITAVLEESAKCDVAMPWTRGTPSLWKSRFACTAPALKKPKSVSA